MKIRILTEEGIDVLKETLVKSHGQHLLDTTPDYFMDYFTKNGWLKETKYEYPDVEFDYNEDFDVSDPINIRAMYGTLRNLPPAMAADERLWAGLAFTDMWNFVQFRRHEELSNGTDFDKLNSFFFMRGGRRSSFIHCLSRMWWIGYLLYDEENKENPYELSDYFASNAFPSAAMLFSSVNLVSNHDIARGVMDAVYDRYKRGLITTAKERRYSITESNKYLNYLGGISIIDSMSRKEVFKLVSEFLENRSVISDSEEVEDVPEDDFDDNQEYEEYEEESQEIEE